MFVLALGAPVVAQAGEVSVPDLSGQPVFRAAGGEANDLRVEKASPPGLVFTDLGAPLQVGAGCEPLASGAASCPGAASATVLLRDRADRARVTVNSTGLVFAGSGADTVIADSFGGSTEVYGEAGDDEVSAGGEGGQVASGGPGDDRVECCGFAGGGTARGGPGDDLITFSTGLPGNADLDGGPGDDTIVAAGAGQPAGSLATARGGPGADRILIEGAAPLGGSAAYAIDGGPGRDDIAAGPDGDTVAAGAGRDSVDTRGGGVDTVSCGPGLDVARFDAGDAVADDCEVRLLAPTGA